MLRAVFLSTRGDGEESLDRIYSIMSVIFAGLALIVAIVSLPTIKLLWNRLHRCEERSDVETGTSRVGDGEQ